MSIVFFFKGYHVRMDPFDQVKTIKAETDVSPSTSSTTKSRGLYPLSVTYMNSFSQVPSKSVYHLHINDG